MSAKFPRFPETNGRIAGPLHTQFQKLVIQRGTSSLKRHLSRANSKVGNLDDGLVFIKVKIVFIFLGTDDCYGPTTIETRLSYGSRRFDERLTKRTCNMTIGKWTKLCTWKCAEEAGIYKVTKRLVLSNVTS